MNRKFFGIILLTLILLFTSGGRFVPKPAPPFAAALLTATPTVTPSARKTMTPTPTPRPRDCTENNPSIGGVITGTVGNAYWFNDIFCVAEDLIVPAGETLTINQGVTLVFSPGQQMIVAGRYTLFHHNNEDFLTEKGADLTKGAGLLYEDPGFAKSPKNFHLQADSAAVNAADPATDYSQEPGYNGGRADLGAYGNTRSAPQQPPEIEPADFTVSANALQQIGKPGEIVTYTVHITNLGSISGSFSVNADAAYRDEFPFTAGLTRGRHQTYYSGSTGTVGPGQSKALDIALKIPDYATQGLVHVFDALVSGRGGTGVELQFTTIVSAAAALEQIGHLGLSPQDIYAQGRYVYLAAGHRGLRIWDISKPANPTEIGFYPPQNEPLWTVRQVAVRSDYAYLAAGQAGLRLIDVSDPADPVEVGFYNTPGSATGVNLKGDYAYVTWRVCNYPLCSNQVRIVDVSTPTHPVEVGIYRTSHTITEVEIVGEWAYVGVRDGLEILNIARPDKPIESVFFEQSRGYWPYDIVSDGAHIYVAARGSGLQIFDISTPTAPLEVTTFNGPDLDTTQALILVDHYLYLVDSDQLYIIDVSTPSAPTLASTTPIEMEEHSRPALVVVEDYVYLTTPSTGLRLIDSSNLTRPKEVDLFGAPNSAQAIAVAGDYAYVADRYTGLRIFDISQGPIPTEVGFYDKPGGAWAVGLKGHYAYVTFGVCGADHLAVDVAVANGVIYLAHDSGGLQLLRYSPPPSTTTPAPTPTRPPLAAPFTSTRPTPTPTPTPTVCDHAPAPPFVDSYADEERAARLGCPTTPGLTTLAAGQQFEKGRMLYFEDTIYVILANNTAERYPDAWDESQAVDDPTLTPPADLHQPIRGFGKVWRERLGGPDSQIGWAVEPEQGYEAAYQRFTGGIMLVAPSGKVLTLFEE